jgi:uncharacterized protein YjbI with pentapeptide repeats
MKIRKFTQSPLLASCQTVRFGGKPFLAVSAFLGFNMDGVPGMLSPADSFGAAAGALSEAADQGCVFDLGLPKPRGEMLAAGSCYPPPGAESAGSASASLRLGRISREFLAVGEAPLLGPGPGKPAPFSSVPLDWRRTARGARNPAGQLRGETRTAYGAILGFPQVTDRREMGGALSAAWPPAASPLPEPFGAAAAGSGTYDRNWLLDAWPGFPADFDMRALNMAQAPQTLAEGYFNGDEAVYAGGMHPGRRELRSRLPAMFPRTVVATLPPGAAPPEPPEISPGPEGVFPGLPGVPDGALFEEIRLNLDTVWLFPAWGAGIMIWHGSTALRDAMASDVWGMASSVWPLPPASAGSEALGTAGPADAGELFMLGTEGYADLPVLQPFAAEIPEPAAPPAPPAPEQAGAAPSPSPPDAAVPPAEAVPPEVPAPGPPPPPAAGAGVPATAAEMVEETRRDVMGQLPEINRMLDEQGLSPVTESDVEDSLRRYGDALDKGMRDMDGIDAGRAARAAMGPAEKAAAEEADVIADLVRGGAAPQEAADLLKAVKLHVPLMSEFRTPEEFETALSDYGSEWARLAGRSPEEGAAYAARMRVASAMENEPERALELILAQSVGEEKAAGLALELKAPPPEIPAGPEELAAALAAGGALSPEEAGALAEAVSGMQALPAGAGMKDVAAAFAEMGGKLARSLGPGAAVYSGKLVSGLGLVKSVLWKEKGLGEALEKLGAEYPEVKAALPELNRIRLDAPGSAGSLEEAARMAGLGNAAALGRIDALDPWTGPPAAPEPEPAPEPESGPEPEPGPESEPEPAAPPEPGPPPLTLAGRAQAEELLAGARSDGSMRGIFAGRIMQGLDLSGMDFSGLDMKGARLTGSDLSGCSFAGADLSGAALDGTAAAGADFAGASLVGADMSRASGGSMVLRDADMAGADFSGADLETSALEGARCPGAVFSGTRLPRELGGGNFAGARFSRWNGEGADLSGADLTGADFTNVNLSSASFRGAVLSKCHFASCDLSRADFGGARARGASFQLFTRLGGTDFSRADLTGATLAVPDASGAVFRGASADRALMAGVRLRNCSFEGASLREASFHGADLRGSDMYGADMMKAGLGGTQLSGADFTGTSLYGADFYLSRPDTSTVFKDADLTGTILLLDGESLVK